MPIIISSASSGPGYPGDGKLTGLQIINRAAELIGYKDADETLTATDQANFLAVLNDIVDSWNGQRMLVVSVGEATATISASPATIGAGMQINMVRPIRLEGGSYVVVGGTKSPLTIVTREEYFALALNSASSTTPEVAYYDRGAPTGLVYFWPSFTTAVEVHLQVQSQLTAFADTTTVYTFAPGYKRALEFSLAEELSAGRRPLDPNIARIAANARRAIRRANLEIQQLDTGFGGRRSNILTGV